MSIFRLHLRPKGGNSSLERTFKYCLKNNLLGVGWRINSKINQEIDWSEYKSKARGEYDKIHTVSYLRNNIKEKDIIWTRDPKGQYYIAQVISPWEYFISEESVKYDIDIANIVKVNFLQIPTDEVPGKVIASFRATRTLQRIISPTVEEYTKYLWNVNNKNNHYSLNPNLPSDIFELLDSEEIEDLVFVYLQFQDYIVVPNSRKADTMSYEYILINKSTKERFFIQIKTGNTPIDIKFYSALGENYFLFQPNNQYQNKESKSSNITIISRNEVLQFLNDNIQFLPKVFERKLDIINLG